MQPRGLNTQPRAEVQHTAQGGQTQPGVGAQHAAEGVQIQAGEEIGVNTGRKGQHTAPRGGGVWGRSA